MKSVRYTPVALKALHRHKAEAKAIMSKVQRYAETGAGDVKALIAHDGAKRLRVGDYRVIFIETADDLLVTRIGPRGSVYEE